MSGQFGNQEIDTFDLARNPKLRGLVSDLQGAYKRNSLALTARIDHSSPAVRELFRAGHLPCFDGGRTSSGYPGELGLLKRCLWRGEAVPCSRVFAAAPTDRGVCCAFNAGAAAGLYRDVGGYASGLDRQRSEDRLMALPEEDVAQVTIE